MNAVHFQTDEYIIFCYIKAPEAFSKTSLTQSETHFHSFWKYCEEVIFSEHLAYETYEQEVMVDGWLSPPQQVDSTFGIL